MVDLVRRGVDSNAATAPQPQRPECAAGSGRGVQRTAEPVALAAHSRSVERSVTVCARVPWREGALGEAGPAAGGCQAGCRHWPNRGRLAKSRLDQSPLRMRNASPLVYKGTNQLKDQSSSGHSAFGARCDEPDKISVEGPQKPDALLPIIGRRTVLRVGGPQRLAAPPPGRPPAPDRAARSPWSR